MSGKIRTWKGQRFEDMSREDLIEALTWAARRLEELQAPEFSHLRAWEKVEAIKRGRMG